METANGRGRSREAQCSRDRDQGPRWEEGTLADGARQVTSAETPRARALCRAGLGEPEGRAWEGRASGLRLPALASSWRGPVLPSVCDVALALAVGTEPTESPGCASLHLLALLGFQERAKSRREGCAMLERRTPVGPAHEHGEALLPGTHKQLWVLFFILFYTLSAKEWPCPCRRGFGMTLGLTSAMCRSASPSGEHMEGVLDTLFHRETRCPSE